VVALTACLWVLPHAFHPGRLQSVTGYVDRSERWRSCKKPSKSFPHCSLCLELWPPLSAVGKVLNPLCQALNRRYRVLNHPNPFLHPPSPALSPQPLSLRPSRSSSSSPLPIACERSPYHRGHRERISPTRPAAPGMPPGSPDGPRRSPPAALRIRPVASRARPWRRRRPGHTCRVAGQRRRSRGGSRRLR